MPPIKRIRWQGASRIQATRFPPIDLFEDLLEPEDWEAAIRLESLTNPRIAESIGTLALVPVPRRVSGPGATLLMAPFTHVSPDRPGRFHDGSFGACYLAQSFATAMRETAYHYGRFFASTQQSPGWFSQYREFVFRVDQSFHDIRHSTQFDDYHKADDWQPSQQLARTLRAEGSNGIAYHSVRHPGGHCLAVFWPDLMNIPVPGKPLSYHFNGDSIDLVRDDAGRKVYRID